MGKIKIGNVKSHAILFWWSCGKRMGGNGRKWLLGFYDRKSGSECGTALCNEEAETEKKFTACVISGKGVDVTIVTHRFIYLILFVFFNENHSLEFIFPIFLSHTDYMLFDTWNKSERGNQNTEPSSCGFIYKNLGPNTMVLMFTCIRKKCSTEESKTLILTKVKTSYENVTTMTAKRFMYKSTLGLALDPIRTFPITIRRRCIECARSRRHYQLLFGCVRISIRVRIRRSVRWLVRP